MSEYYNSMEDWTNFSSNMISNYNINVDVLTTEFDKEQLDYFVYSALWTELHPEHLIGHSIIIKQLDLNTCTLKDAEGIDDIHYNIKIPFNTKVSGFAGWFTTDFMGSENIQLKKRVVLSTGPEVGYTHWGQQVFYLKDAITCSANSTISGNLSMTRQPVNQRLYNLNISVTVNENIENEQNYIYEIP